MEKDKDLFNISKKENFSEWYLELVRRAKLMDQRSPIKGFDVIMPNAYSMWEKIQDYLNPRFAEVGARNAYFPLLIPESFLHKEAEHFEGFIPEVAWVTHGGNEKLETRLAIRPTSETIINHMFSLWIRSYQDLPLLINQWCNIVRWETKMTKPFLRGREFLWQEGHTAFATKEEAEKNVIEICNIYKSLLEELLRMPCILVKRPDWDKFAGADVTVSLETLMPDGKVLQAGTVHNLGQNFAKPFEIQFLDQSNDKKYVWQTSWGVSTRLIGGVVMVHGDDKGLVLPCKLAPVQVAIIPILFKGKEKPVLEKCRKVKERLEKAGYTTALDDSEERPGMKHYYWEMVGAPVRIEIGPRDVEGKELVVVTRDNSEKKTIKDGDLLKTVKREGEALDKRLFEKANENLKGNITEAKTDEDVKRFIKKGAIVKAPFCSTDLDGQKCADILKEATGGADVKGTLYPEPEKPRKGDKCIVCGKEANEIVYIAKSY